MPGPYQENGEDAPPGNSDCVGKSESGSTYGHKLMARISDLHQKWMKNSAYRKAYASLEDEFVLAAAVIDVRNRAGLTQQQLARKMGTTQPVVARLESGRIRPSMRTLERLAKATGSRLLINFEPLEKKTGRANRSL
jgi:ribosome-binding protein aMBF1 (putative translation factor)